MKISLLPVLLTLALSFSAIPALGADDPDVTAITVKNLAGENVTPLKCSVTAKEKAVVVIFITTDCPIANSFVPEINRLQLAYSERNVRFTLVHVDPDLTQEKARQHASDYALKPAIVLDRQHALVKATAAKVTPEAFVYDAEGKLRYRGRINNLYADRGQRRSQVTAHELRDAIEAVISGRKVTITRTEALGCYIEEP
jgi:thiol-disulfide isomerase/thioredoxin